MSPNIRYEKSHNPYFNRWFSAIIARITKLKMMIVTILILIDGFLQFICVTDDAVYYNMSQSLF